MTENLRSQSQSRPVPMEQPPSSASASIHHPDSEQSSPKTATSGSPSGTVASRLQQRKHRNSNILYRFRLKRREKDREKGGISSGTGSGSGSGRPGQNFHRATSKEQAAVGSNRSIMGQPLESIATDGENRGLLSPGIAVANGTSSSSLTSSTGGGKGLKRFMKMSSRRYRPLVQEDDEGGIVERLETSGSGRKVLQEINSSADAVSSKSHYKQDDGRRSHRAHPSPPAVQSISVAVSVSDISPLSNASSLHSTPQKNQVKKRKSSVQQQQHQQEREEEDSGRITADDASSPSIPLEGRVGNVGMGTDTNSNDDDHNRDTSPCSTGSIQKKYRPDQIRHDDHDDTSDTVSLPPINMLELNPSSSPPSFDLDSSGTASGSSSISPTSMDPDAFKSLYFNDDHETRHRHIHDDHYRRPSEDEMSYADPDEIDYELGNSDDEDELGRNHNDDGGDDGSIEDEDGETDESCDSTVVNDLPPRVVRPPPSATREEQARFYWDLCYGKPTQRGKKNDDERMNCDHVDTSGDEDMNHNINPNDPSIITNPEINTIAGAACAGSWSASREAPSKSCLSAKKTAWTAIAESASKRMRNRMTNRQSSLQKRNSTPTTAAFEDGPRQLQHWREEDSPMEKITLKFSTPQSNEDDNGQLGNGSNGRETSGKKSVKFGAASAAEFESARPPVELTPLPADQVQEHFRVDEEEMESDEESTEMHQETARNGDILGMWEDDFDSYVEEWDVNDSIMSTNSDEDSDDEKREALVARMTHLPRSRSSNGRDMRRRSSDRRSSTFFSRNGGSLCEDDGSSEIQRPSKAQSINVTESQQSGTNKIDGRNRSSLLSRDSLQFSSPSTVNDSYHLSSSGSESSKHTPTNDVTSSSSLLRSVHSAGGASMGSMDRAADSVHDDATQYLKPNQLDLALQRAEGSETLYRSEKKIETTQPDLFTRLLENDSHEAMRDFSLGELLHASNIDFSKAHDVASSFAIDSVQDVHENNKASFLRIVEEIDETIQSDASAGSSVCRCDVADVIKMSISLLEQQNLTDKSENDGQFHALIKDVHSSFGSEDLEEIYLLFAEIANSEWLQFEVQTLQTAQSWLKPLHESNREEEEKICASYENVHFQSERKERDGVETLKKHCRDEMNAIEILEARLEEEERNVERAINGARLLACKSELERSKPPSLVSYQLLNYLLPFECRLVDGMSISYRHLDGRGSETRIVWNSPKSPPRDSKRTSFGTVESSESLATVVANTPKVKRFKTRQQGQYRKHGGYLAKGSVSRKLYCILLESDQLQRFITEQFKYEHEMAILTVSDVFQRLDLLVLDVVELHKYYTCKVVTPARSNSVVLHVSISIGQMCSIRIRFTYDLSMDRTILLSSPSQVFVEPITGEPAVPTNILQRVAEQAISSAPCPNALILKRTCTAVVDTLQGRNEMHMNV